MKVYGFDLNQKIMNTQKKGVNAYQCNFEDFYNMSKLRGHKFDMASARGYFDMVDDPLNEIKA